MKKLLLATAAIVAIAASSVSAQQASWTVGGFAGATQGVGSSYGGSQGYAGTGHIGNAWSTAQSSGVGEAESGYNAGINPNGSFSFNGSSMVHTGSMGQVSSSSSGNGFTAGSAGNQSWGGTSLQGWGGALAGGARN